MPKPKSRAARWGEAVAQAQEKLGAARSAMIDLIASLSDIEEIRQEYQDWRNAIPDNLEGSAVAEKLEEVCGIDFASFDEESASVGDVEEALTEAEGLDLPQGFGRD